MSYCRFSEGDVYLVQAREQVWSCYGCALGSSAEPYVDFTSLREAKAHLEAHVAAGHNVPERALNRVEMELFWLELSVLDEAEEPDSEAD